MYTYAFGQCLEIYIFFLNVHYLNELYHHIRVKHLYIYYLMSKENKLGKAIRKRSHDFQILSHIARQHEASSSVSGWRVMKRKFIKKISRIFRSLFNITPLVRMHSPLRSYLGCQGALLQILLNWIDYEINSLIFISTFPFFFSFLSCSLVHSHIMFFFF